MAKKWPLAIATYILIPLVKVLSDGGDEVQYQGFCLIFDIDGASSIKIFTLLSIFVWVKLVVPKSDLFLCTVLQPAMSRSAWNHNPIFSFLVIIGVLSQLPTIPAQQMRIGSLYLKRGSSQAIISNVIRCM